MSTEDDQLSVESAMDSYKNAVERAQDIANDEAALASGTDIVAIASSPELVKQRLLDVRISLSNAQKEVKVSRERLESAIADQQKLMDAKLAEMEAFMKPLQKQMARVADGIDAMNLYMGRDEFIITIREGEKAPKTDPIVIRQRVLAMDEETAIDAVNGGIDAMDIEKFDEWLLADPKNLEQVIPESKSVVVLRVRAAAKDYGDPWQAMAMAAANEETWWLIRNGDNLYRMVTEFQVGENLVPKSDEFTKLFAPSEKWGRTTEAPKPGTDEWLQAEQRADAKTRHYMKIALILQGLVDRTEVFRPLAIDGLSVIDNRYYDEGYVKVITDSEMAIESNLIPFSTWLHQKNSKVDIGTRVIFGSISRNSKDMQYIYPKWASAPSIHVPYVVKDKTDSRFIISYPRTDEVWTDDTYGVAKTSASYRFYGSDGDHIAIDYVSVEEMEAYLAARSQRKSYAKMFPVLRAAIAFKKAEIEQEAPFRALLEAELDKAGYSDSVDDLIFWWKTAHKWNRPLLGSQDNEAKATRAILSEAKRRNGSSDDEAVASKLHALYPDAMAILRGNANYVVMIPEVYAVPPKRSSDNVFLRRVDVTKTGIVKNDTRWGVITKAQNARLTAIYKTAQWEGWNIGADADKFLSEPDYLGLLEVGIDYVKESLGKTPVVATVDDFGIGWNADIARINIFVTHDDIDLDAPLRLTKGFDPLISSTMNMNISKKKGIVRFHSGYGNDKYYAYDSHEYWRAKHNDFITPGKDSGDLTPPWGDSGERHFVWVDSVVMEEEIIFARKYKNLKITFAELDKKADRLVSGIVESWFEEYDKKMYSRFMEDFGDDSGWEDFRLKKRKSTQFPYPATVEKFGYNRERKSGKDTLRWLVQRLVETGHPPYDLTVEEAYAGSQLLLTNTDHVELPDDIKGLRFLSEESNEMVKAS